MTGDEMETGTAVQPGVAGHRYTGWRSWFGTYWTVVPFGWLAVVVSAAPGPGALRVVVVFTFVFVGPGIPIIGILSQRGPLEHLVLAIVTSVSLATLVAEGMALFGWWSAVSGLAVLAGITSVAAVLDGARDRAHQEHAGPGRPGVHGSAEDRGSAVDRGSADSWPT
ncbi:MAG: hypothetical protein QOJ44_625 [Acidimicrobiaceae bacterium]|jgi:hypothetical protein|nr:hypothetical protein [Acidimicrobiaceae bacterium]